MLSLSCTESGFTSSGQSPLGAKQKSQDSSSQQKISESSGRPSEEGEGIPGYLTSVEQISIVDNKDNTYTISGKAESTQSSSNEGIDIFVYRKINQGFANQNDFHNSNEKGALVGKTLTTRFGNFEIVVLANPGDQLYISTTPEAPRSTRPSVAVITLEEGGGQKKLLSATSPVIDNKPGETFESPSEPVSFDLYRLSRDDCRESSFLAVDPNGNKCLENTTPFITEYCNYTKGPAMTLLETLRRNDTNPVILPERINDLMAARKLIEEKAAWLGQCWIAEDPGAEDVNLELIIVIDNQILEFYYFKFQRSALDQLFIPL